MRWGRKGRRESLSEQPPWWNRQYIEPYRLSDAEAWKLIESPPFYCVFAWVTREPAPVACAMAYVVLDGCIMLTSTANRDKVKAILRNPAVCLCFHRGLRQVTLRGRAELSSDPQLVARWVSAHLDRWDRPLTPEQRAAETQRFLSPDRVIIVVRAEKLRSFDGAEMFRAETSG
jgi:hypothetical protein